MEFAVDRMAFSIHHLEGVGAVAVHVAVAVRKPPVTEQEGHLHRDMGTPSSGQPFCSNSAFLATQFICEIAVCGMTEFKSF